MISGASAGFVRCRIALWWLRRSMPEFDKLPRARHPAAPEKPRELTSAVNSRNTFFALAAKRLQAGTQNLMRVGIYSDGLGNVIAGAAPPAFSFGRLRLSETEVTPISARGAIADL